MFFAKCEICLFITSVSKSSAELWLLKYSVKDSEVEQQIDTESVVLFFLYVSSNQGKNPIRVIRCFILRYVHLLSSDKNMFYSFANIVSPSNKGVFITFWIQKERILKA